MCQIAHGLVRGIEAGCGISQIGAAGPRDFARAQSLAGSVGRGCAACCGMRPPLMAGRRASGRWGRPGRAPTSPGGCWGPKSAAAPRGAAFAIAAGLLFAVLAVLWLLVARGDRPEYRRASRLFVTGTAACAVLLAGTALLPAGTRVPAWGLLDAAYLAGFAAIFLTASPGQQSAALTITDALIERFGLLTIIVLGETLTGVVTGLARKPISGLTLAAGLVAVVVGFGAWWTYFDFAGHRHPRPDPAPSLQWLLGHLPLTAAIAPMAAAMVSLVDHAHDG